ncbi:MAG: transglycosylase domain-containing protein [Defluviitaleaceae bacterium]|nr:transglycosylase domain-containing protein [Defluviitaleaceae bacterium]
MDYSRESNAKKKKAAVSKAKKAQNRIVTVAFRAIAAFTLIILFAVGGTVLGAYVGIIESAPPFVMGAMTPNNFNSTVYDMYGNEIWSFHAAGARRLHAPFYVIPEHLINAFIAIEDERFFEHHGVDVRGTLRAVYVSFIARTGKEGGSTITQQLVKNEIMGLMANDATTKLQEQFIALQAEAQLTEYFDGDRMAAKNYILYRYLNSIALGPGIHGVQMAAQHYFGRNVYTLTLAESAIIASITQSPTALDPSRFPYTNRQRAVTVLNRMLAQGLITETEHEYATNDLYYAAYERIDLARAQIEEVEVNVQSFFVDHLVEALAYELVAQGVAMNRNAAMARIHGGGLRIHTTMNQTVQRILEEAYLDDSHFPASAFQILIDSRISATNNYGDIVHFIMSPEANYTVPNMDAFENWVYNRVSYVEEQGYVIIAQQHLPIVQPQSAMVVIDHHTGQVRGIVGGRGKKTENLAFNRATQAERQPGSVFKILTSYAPAMDLGLIVPDSPLVDAPIVWEEFNNFSPSNFDNRFRGRTNVRQAVAHSFNTTAVSILRDVGIDTAFNYLLNFGFTTLVDGVNERGQTDRVPSTALGGLTYGVTQLELAAAFATIANGGMYIEPIVFTRVYDQWGNLVLEANQARRQVLQPTTAYLLTETMIGVVSGGTGTMARLDNGMETAGKTGTSQHTNDLMFAGYSPHLTASVWLGHDHPRTINTASLSAPHTRIWSYIMNKIHEELNKPIITSFDRPSGLVQTDRYIGRPAPLATPSNRIETNVAIEGYSRPSYPDEDGYEHTGDVLYSEDGNSIIIYDGNELETDVDSSQNIDNFPPSTEQFSPSQEPPPLTIPPLPFDPSAPQTPSPPLNFDSILPNQDSSIIDNEELTLPDIPPFDEEQFNSTSPSPIIEYDED